jgi:hypothetical protein
VIGSRNRWPFVLGILLLGAGLPVLAQAATYYVSNAGSDTYSGLSTAAPWQTLGKVNGVTLTAGDQVLFKRGDAFYGSLTIWNSGMAGNPIVFGAYDAGVNPVITGFTAVTDWTNLGGNIWESTNPVSTLATCNLVAIQGNNTAMGRTPNRDAANGGYWTYQSHSGNTAITSSTLTGTPDWTGADVVIRTGRYSIDRSVIASQAGGTLNLATATVCTPADNFGFFIQNDPRTLDAQNEWYYNPSTRKIRIYSLAQPTGVQMATVEKLVEFEGGWNASTGANSAYGNYTRLESLAFTGANSYGIYTWDHWWVKLHDVSVQNCSLAFSGIDAIFLQCNTLNLQGNRITDSNAKAIEAGGCTGVTISHNVIGYSGVLTGMAPGNGTFAAVSLGGTGTGAGHLVEYNTITQTAHNAITYGADGTTIRYNYIDTYCTVIDDGAGIYGGSNALITRNITVNGIGNADGTDGTFPMIAAGIYCDNNSDADEISYNTICHTSGYGLFNNDDVGHMNIHDNTVFDASLAQWRINVKSTNTTSGFTVANNLFVSKQSAQEVLYFFSVANNVQLLGTFDYNIYARPLDDNVTLQIQQPDHGGASAMMTLANWQAFSGQDAHAGKSPQAAAAANDIQCYYNNTLGPQAVTLAQPMMDMKGNRYWSSLTLQPFTSAVLMKDAHPQSPTPSATVTPSATATPALTPTPTPTALSGSATATAGVDMQGRTVVAFPNPASGQVRFLLNLPAAAEVKILLFNTAGRTVAQVSGNLPAGQGPGLVWHCATVAPGIYLAQVQVDGKVRETLKIAVAGK